MGMIMRRLSPACLALVAFMSSAAWAADPCGSLKNGVGPYDYRKAPPREKYLVESYHFTESDENLSSGNTTKWVAGDISYVLRAFPNHVRALAAITELGRREHTDKPHESLYTITCWFERAIRFRPDDGEVRLLFGIHLMNRGLHEKAIEQLIVADRLRPDDRNINYNLGLAYFETKDYEKARERAKKAYALGFPLPGLRDMLTRVNQWN
jgi:tetratricopeptide (TPR) repeat protein